MQMNHLVALLGGLVLLAGVIWFCLDSSVFRFRGGTERKVKRSPLLVALVGALVLSFGFSFTVVPTGYTGVRTTFGLIDQQSCKSGFNIVTPFVQTISLVNNKQQDVRFEERVWSETREQTVVYMEGIAVTYQINPESSAWIYANVENWVQELVDQDIVSSSAKSASRKLGADTVTDRSVIEPAVREQLQTSLDEKYGPDRVEIKTVIINNIDFEDSYNQAIAQKSNAIQDQQRQEILNQTNIDKAKADAEAERERARGEADAERIRAEGKADAAETIAKSITNETLRQDIIDKWNGEVPRYVGGEGSMFGIIDSETSTGGSSSTATNSVPPTGTGR